MDIAQRRALITTIDNPNKVNDYIITLKTRCTRTNRQLCLRYIPDRWIIDVNAIQNYFDQLLEDTGRTLEDTANLLLEDINNELVARWVQVHAEHECAPHTQHSIVIEDRQPQWDNPHLLARIAKN